MKCQVSQGPEHSRRGKVQSFWLETASMLHMGYCIEQSKSMHRQTWPLQQQLARIVKDCVLGWRFLLQVNHSQ